MILEGTSGLYDPIETDDEDPRRTTATTLFPSLRPEIIAGGRRSRNGPTTTLVCPHTISWSDPVNV